jgi:hypothetical protein
LTFIPTNDSIGVFGDTLWTMKPLLLLGIFGFSAYCAVPYIKTLSPLLNIPSPPAASKPADPSTPANPGLADQTDEKIVPPDTSIDQVRRQYGEPQRVFTGPNGAQTYYYQTVVIYIINGRVARSQRVVVPGLAVSQPRLLGLARTGSIPRSGISTPLPLGSNSSLVYHGPMEHRLYPGVTVGNPVTTGSTGAFAHGAVNNPGVVVRPGVVAVPGVVARPVAPQPIVHHSSVPAPVIVHRPVVGTTN